jgi:hypothetical protein
LQQGRFRKAKEILNNQLAFTQALPSAAARTHFVVMRGHYLIESNDWTSDITEEKIKLNDLRLETRSLDRFVSGLVAYRNSDKQTLANLITEIDSDIAQAQQMKVINEGIAQCQPGRYTQGVPSQAGITQASILNEELKALLAFSNDDTPQANAHFRKAVDMEQVNGHFYGPPEILKPTNEFFGEFLLAINRPKEAITSFEKALEKTRGRNQSLVGLLEASRKIRDAQKQMKAEQTLRANIATGDGEAPLGFFNVH